MIMGIALYTHNFSTDYYFADECTISWAHGSSLEDFFHLQQDLDKLVELTKFWQMTTNSKNYRLQD